MRILPEEGFLVSQAVFDILRSRERLEGILEIFDFGAAKVADRIRTFAGSCEQAGERQLLSFRDPLDHSLSE